jgi:hypothetical protein
MQFRVAGFLTALLLAPLAHAQDAFVVPSANESVEGDSNSAIPFFAPGRYQQVYLADDIPAGPLTIYGIAFRPDVLESSFALEIPSVDVYLGTTTQGTDLDPEFSVNVGGDETLVASGALPLSSAATGPPGGPLDFDIRIWFDQPFAYEGGNLLLDVFVSGVTGRVVKLFDAVNLDMDPVSRVYPSRGGSAGSPTGIVDTQGLVTQFMLVPEPTTGSAFAAIAALAVLARRRAGALARLAVAGEWHG